MGRADTSLGRLLATRWHIGGGEGWVPAAARGVRHDTEDVGLWGDSALILVVV